MNVIILAGGLGTRLGEQAELVPKPMVRIGGRPILWHIMQTYARFGHKEFFVAAGYKADAVKEYFLNYRALNADFTVDLGTGELKSHDTNCPDWRVTVVDTGTQSMTGGRVKRMQRFAGHETSLLTYGDGVANIDIGALIAFHRAHGKMVTVTAVRPAARFGELELEGDAVVRFAEKPQLQEGWVSGGFFVIEPALFDLIEGDETMLEREPLEKAAALGQLMAYKHNGFWHCMDTKRDHELLESLCLAGAPPWSRT